MNYLISLVILVLQFVVAQLLGFGVANALGVGNGWELVVFALGNTLGVWGVGALADRLRDRSASATLWLRLAGTLIGSILGVVLILVTPPTGFGQILYPLIGALLGYHLAPLIRR